MGARTSKLTPRSIKELRTDVDFTADEIQEWFTEYKTRLKNGHNELTKDEFQNVYNSIFTGDASEFAEHVFRTFDADGSGAVDFREFLIGLCVSGSRDSEVLLKWAFTMYDINGDGSITPNEMNRIISAIYKMTEARTPDEFDTPDKMTERLFSQFDLNNDGQITWDEFKIGASKDPVIVKLLQCDPDADGDVENT